MTSNTRTGQEVTLATTDSSSHQELDVQKIGRDLYFHRHIYRPYRSSSESNPLMQAVWDVYPTQSRINEYVFILTSALLCDIGDAPEALKGERLDDQFKYLARRVSRTFGVYDEECETSEIHDFREAGVAMDLDRAEELCRKMMEK